MNGKGMALLGVVVACGIAWGALLILIFNALPWRVSVLIYGSCFLVALAWVKVFQGQSKER